MIRMRGGSGLGDSIYLRPIAEKLRGVDAVAVMSNYPDVFLGSGVIVEPFRRERVDRVVHYVGGKGNTQTTIWEDMQAHAKLEAPLSFDWPVKNRRLVDALRVAAAGRPILVVNGGREPMGRRDRFGVELLPERRAFLAALDVLDDCLTVRVGAGPEMYSLPTSLDYTGRTSVSDLLDIFRVAHGVVGQCSFAIPGAEVFDRPLLLVWSARAALSRQMFIKTITPTKMLSKPANARVVVDDQADEDIAAGARAWLEELVGVPCAS